jgi:hypothetical protein
VGSPQINLSKKPPPEGQVENVDVGIFQMVNTLYRNYFYYKNTVLLHVDYHLGFFTEKESQKGRIQQPWVGTPGTR